MDLPSTNLMGKSRTAVAPEMLVHLPPKSGAVVATRSRGEIKKAMTHFLGEFAWGRTSRRLALRMAGAPA